MKLVKGSGSPDKGACWMSAISWYAGENWNDMPDCVCPIIWHVCVCANDLMRSDEEREREIGPVIFDVVGTRNLLFRRVRAEMAIEFAQKRVRGTGNLMAINCISHALSYVSTLNYIGAVVSALNAAALVSCLKGTEMRDLALAMAKIGEREEVAQVREMEELPA